MLETKQLEAPIRAHSSIKRTPTPDAFSVGVSIGLWRSMAPASPSGDLAGTRALTDTQTLQAGATSDAVREPEVKDLELRLGRPSLKRKEVESSGHRFKIVSQLVIAMKRFQGMSLITSSLLLLSCRLVSKDYLRHFQDPTQLMALDEQQYACDSAILRTFMLKWCAVQLP